MYCSMLTAKAGLASARAATPAVVATVVAHTTPLRRSAVSCCMRGLLSRDCPNCDFDATAVKTGVASGVSLSFGAKRWTCSHFQRVERGLSEYSTRLYFAGAFVDPGKYMGWRPAHTPYPHFCGTIADSTLLKGPRATHRVIPYD
jgi:hypothetical protein